jgi:hypothetical protein
MERCAVGLTVFNQMRPPWLSTMERPIANPSPILFCLVLKNESNNLGRFSIETPRP